MHIIKYVQLEKRTRDFTVEYNESDRKWTNLCTYSHVII